MTAEPTEAFARAMDARDELASFRELFYVRPGEIYLDGNSLGLLSRPAEAALLRALDEWKTRGIDGWAHAAPPWLTLAEELAGLTAPLLGAEAEAVIVANSTTVNLHQLLATLFRPEAGRATILIDALSFPSDRYAIQSHLRLRGLDPERCLKTVPSADGRTLNEDAIIDAMTPDVALAVLPTVVYTSGQLLDVARLAAEGRRRGVLVGFDGSHSLGMVPHRLDDWGVDFAFWCSYKYLNAGPGATGGLYLNRRHFGTAPGLAGWFSSDKDAQFDMAPTLVAAGGAAALQIGTPNVLSMAPLHGALELTLRAGIERIRAKSLAQTEYLMALADTELAAYGFRTVTPRKPERRGGHVALRHPEASRICQALKAAGVVPDHRPPDLLRLAPAPLYTSFAECWEAVRRLREVMERRGYEAFPAGRDRVP
jgi:kynureninase